MSQRPWETGPKSDHDGRGDDHGLPDLQAVDSGQDVDGVGAENGLTSTLLNFFSFLSVLPWANPI
jgi:hypothetical protein